MPLSGDAMVLANAADGRRGVAGASGSALRARCTALEEEVCVFRALGTR